MVGSNFIPGNAISESGSAESTAPAGDFTQVRKLLRLEP